MRLRWKRVFSVIGAGDGCGDQGQVRQALWEIAQHFAGFRIEFFGGQKQVDSGRFMPVPPLASKSHGLVVFRFQRGPPRLWTHSEEAWG
jgi:hypothetical protein